MSAMPSSAVCRHISSAFIFINLLLGLETHWFGLASAGTHNKDVFHVPSHDGVHVDSLPLYTTADNQQLRLPDSANLKHLPQSWQETHFHDRYGLPRRSVRQKHWIRAKNTKRNGVAAKGTWVNRVARHVLESNASNGNKEDMEALIRLKTAISSDPLRALRSWRTNDTTACHWTGVECSPTNQNRVVSVNLRGLQLRDNFNSAMSALSEVPFLSSLDLSMNNFNGIIPGSRLANFSSLTYLNASFNQVSGPTPLELQDVTNLEVLDFESNNLTGQIPATIGNCSSLGYINLGANLLKGTIPEELGTLSQLSNFFAGNHFPHIVYVHESQGNDISGSIPSSLGNCSNLAVFVVKGNPKLGGPLPLGLGQLQNLKTLVLDYCSFKGILPSWLVNLTSLTELGLQYNRLHGSIPKGIGQLVHLRGLYLSGLSLTGTFPEDFFNCTEMISLTVLSNFMTGNIPHQIGSFTNLEELSVGDNRFTGVIPSDLGNCSQLTFLDWYANPLMDAQGFPTWVTSLPNLIWLLAGSTNMVGPIPNDIGKLFQLKDLELSQNNLIGAIPSSLQNCTSLENLYLWENRLVGRVPQELGSLVRLQAFGFSRNGLTGSIPTFIGNMTQLQYLDGAMNFFEGTIEGDWSKLSQLLGVSFASNQLSGPIPTMLNNCSNLSFLDLSQNKLSGPIPFKNFSTLQELRLSNNNIHGKIPMNLDTCSSLGNLDLSMNYLDGELRSDLSRLTSLTYLNLSYNELNILEARALSNYSNINVIDLSHNHFIGNPPGESMSMLTTLNSFNISHNTFSGLWLHEWTTSQSLLEMDISFNRISGSFPDFANSRGLRTLDISKNNFSGAIPKYLATWSSLQIFNASYNNFEGPIPTSLQRNITADSFAGMPGLCGDILGPLQQCPVQYPPSHDSCQGFAKCKRIWIPVFCVAVGLIVVAMVVLVLWIRAARAKVTSENDEFDLLVNFGAPIRFSPLDISRIMTGDGENKVIGSGAKSVVYKGSLPGGEVVAVKTFVHVSRDIDEGEAIGVRENGWQKHFREATTQAELRHRNVLKVLSFCSSVDVTAIILEYMPQGSLQGHLYRGEFGGSRSCNLPWNSRISIAFNVAEGMKYLHHDRSEPLIHGDLKPTNILLDDNLVAKIADFGISRTSQSIGEGEATASGVRGTIGYMPPEYAFATSLSTAGDVYSYGILLLELLTGRRPTASASNLDHGLEAELKLRDWVLKRFPERPATAPWGVLDPVLEEESRTDSLKSQQMMLTLKIGLFATRELPESRPSMNDVLVMLMQVRDLGLETVTRRTTAELVAKNDLSSANGISMWAGDEPNAPNLPSLP